MNGSESDKADGSASGSTTESTAETTSNAQQNREKLAEHLANLKARGGKSEKPRRESGNSETAGGEGQREVPKPHPKPPPQPQGWDAWKQTHGNRIHSINPQDKQRMAEEADYRTLELKPGATRDEVKRAFNRLAKQYHPDTGGDAEIFQAMLAAYQRIMGE